MFNEVLDCTGNSFTLSGINHAFAIRKVLYNCLQRFNKTINPLDKIPLTLGVFRNFEAERALRGLAIREGWPVIPPHGVSW